MATRVTNAMLESAVKRLNELAGKPVEPWTRKDGKLRANIGNYNLYGAYGSTGLHQMTTEGGGVREIFGLTTKRELLEKINAFMTGMESKAGKNPRRKKATAKRNPRGGQPDEIAAHELALYAENESSLYPQKLAIAKNLLRKMRKGTYDHSQAWKAWLHWYTNAAKKYAKEFSTGSDWNQIFSMATRKHAAENRADEMKREMENGEYDFVLEKNPRRKKKYVHKHIRSASTMAKGSIRSKTVGRGKKKKIIRVGCPKGPKHYNKKTKKCRVGTRVVSVLTPKKNPRTNYATFAIAHVGKHKGKLFYFNGEKFVMAPKYAKRMSKDSALKLAQRYADLNPLTRFGVTAIK
jgi:hypothetical protein